MSVDGTEVDEILHRATLLIAEQCADIGILMRRGDGTRVHAVANQIVGLVAFFTTHDASSVLTCDSDIGTCDHVLDVDGGEDIVFDHAFGHDDGVFVVVTVPGHVSDEDVLA